ncbi:MAG: hypothetical protein FJ197_05485 [Gammaproteobacteria bacterium]|nr:hypothetical protein [Gammaproteobacteria bacterium]
MARQIRQGAALVAAGVLLASCAGTRMNDPYALTAIPDDDRYCLSAQRVVTRTLVPVQMQIHGDFDAFVKSKATIDGRTATIHQYNWFTDDGRLTGISCKLKNTDHLNLVYGPGSAGPDGLCQDMNRAVYELVRREVPAPRYPRVVFDPNETVFNAASPGMTGPDWLAPFTLTSVDADGALRIHTKGFIVNFLDPAYAQMPERFRGVHYCHFIAPGHLRDLLTGSAEAGARIGRQVVPAPPG